MNVQYLLYNEVEQMKVSSFMINIHTVLENISMNLK